MAHQIGSDTKLDFIYDLHLLIHFTKQLESEFLATRIVTRLVYSSTQSAMSLGLGQDSLKVKTAPRKGHYFRDLFNSLKRKRDWAIDLSMTDGRVKEWSSTINWIVEQRDLYEHLAYDGVINHVDTLKENWCAAINLTIFILENSKWMKILYNTRLPVVIDLATRSENLISSLNSNDVGWESNEPLWATTDHISDRLKKWLKD